MKIYDDYTPQWAKIVPIMKGKYAMWRILIQESYRENFIWTMPKTRGDKWTLTEAIEGANSWVSSNVGFMEHRVHYGITIDYSGITSEHQI